MQFQSDPQAWLPEFLRSGPGETLLVLTIVVAAVLLVHTLGRRYLLRFVHGILQRSPMKWDDLLVEHHVLRRAYALVPLIVLQAGLELVPGISPELLGLFLRLVEASMLLVVARTVAASLSVLHSMYNRRPRAATRPIKSYVQLLKVFVYIIAGVFIVARLADQSPWYFVSGLGAMMAVITLVFRDTLLSLVAGVQLTNNDLIRVGDWIEMPQFAADGDVVDIALNTVRVQNWDKTFTVIPTHKFLEHSFKNWRGMQESGGRRIKRSIHINMSSIRFLSEEEIEHFERFVLLKHYVQEKKQELEIFNAAYAGDPHAIVNARRLTNVGTFRAYVVAYLRNHPAIHNDLTFLVRQLQPTAEGLPIEIYVFVNDTRWAVYEGVQADIFDHLLAIAPEFGLRIYQRPSSYDLEAAKMEL
jgi:miniconductance mechanosensitive channel